jgi:hypothetical protein
MGARRTGFAPFTTGTLIGMMFVGVRRSLNGIAVNAGLLARVARRLETIARGL